MRASFVSPLGDPWLGGDGVAAIVPFADTAALLVDATCTDTHFIPIVVVRTHACHCVVSLSACIHFMSTYVWYKGFNNHFRPPRHTYNNRQNCDRMTGIHCEGKFHKTDQQAFLHTNVVRLQ